MAAPSFGIPAADRVATPTSVKTLIFAQPQEIQVLRQENEKLRIQLTELASLR